MQDIGRSALPNYFYFSQQKLYVFAFITAHRKIAKWTVFSLLIKSKIWFRIRSNIFHVFIFWLLIRAYHRFSGDIPQIENYLRFCINSLIKQVFHEQIVKKKLNFITFRHRATALLQLKSRHRPEIVQRECMGRELERCMRPNSVSLTDSTRLWTPTEVSQNLLIYNHKIL